MQQHGSRRYGERRSGKHDRASQSGARHTRSGGEGGGRHKHRERDGKGVQWQDGGEGGQRKPAGVSAATTPIPIDLRPSGVLTKYLHLSAGQKVAPHDARAKYAPPEDAVVPTKENCAFHLFKYNEETDTQEEVPLLNYKSYFVFGRDAELADVVVADDEDGDLVSKQHAVLQFRRGRDATADAAGVRCYLMDIGSTNGTFLNDDKAELPTKRYVQLKNNDVFKLGDYDSVLEFMVLEDRA